MSVVSTEEQRATEGSRKGDMRPANAFRAMGRTLALLALAPVEILVCSLLVVAISLISLGLGIFLVPAAVIVTRGLLNIQRRCARDWSGVEIGDPYLPRRDNETGVKGWLQRTMGMLSDQATWRDLLWMLVNPVVGVLILALPLSFFAYGLFGAIMPFLWEPLTDAGGNNWYVLVHVTNSGTALTAAVLGAPLMLVGYLTGPAMLRVHARFARGLLGPTEMARKVHHLTATRSDAVTTNAAELRRIERDLHDGAQARLVAMGMNLGVAERMLSKDPEAARTILADTRTASAKALNELRDLVRGIHPPVLADRGLADAVRALGMDSPLQVEVNAELPGRPEAPVESAMYFAISESLTNAAKHGSARNVTADVWYSDGMLRAQVMDDGAGGADPANGTGLRGMERRLATFDGVLALTSPVGGPTTLTMELPCVLS